MKKFLKSPTTWLLAIMIGCYICIPLYTLATDTAKEQVVVLDGQNWSVWVEYDTQQIRIPAGVTPSVLYYDNGRVKKNTCLPPARFLPGMVDKVEANSEETRLYKQIFGSTK
jgi:hypothetical protein